MAACRGFKNALLIENTAGQGDSVGCQFEQLKRLRRALTHPTRWDFASILNTLSPLVTIYAPKTITKNLRSI